MEEFVDFSEFPELILHLLTPFDLYNLSSVNTKIREWCEKNIEKLSLLYKIPYSDTLESLVFYYSISIYELVEKACKIGDIRVVKDCINRGIVVSSKNTAPYKCASRGHIEILRCLLADGGSIYAALRGLAKSGNTDLFIELNKEVHTDAIFEAYIHEREDIIQWYKDQGVYVRDLNADSHTINLSEYGIPQKYYYYNLKFDGFHARELVLYLLVKLDIKTPLVNKKKELLLRNDIPNTIRWCVKHDKYLYIIKWNKKMRRVFNDSAIRYRKFSLIEDFSQIDSTAFCRDIKTYNFFISKEIKTKHSYFTCVTEGNLTMLKLTLDEEKISEGSYSFSLDQNSLEVFDFFLYKYGLPKDQLIPKSLEHYFFLLKRNLLGREYLEILGPVNEENPLTVKRLLRVKLL